MPPESPHFKWIQNIFETEVRSKTLVGSAAVPDSYS
jgi:hypothetical protein